MNEEQLRLQSARARREFMRWVLLLAANINRPTQSTLRFLLQVVQGEYPDATSLEVRREMEYLETRELMRLVTDPVGSVMASLTRHGIDIAEYTTACEAGIMRPPKD